VAATVSTTLAADVLARGRRARQQLHEATVVERRVRRAYEAKTVDYTTMRDAIRTVALLEQRCLDLALVIVVLERLAGE